jgi:hypothetical protein
MALAGLLAACGDGAGLPDEAALLLETTELGRVHIVVDYTAADGDENDASLDIAARFVQARGLDEEFVRARIEMPIPAEDQLSVGQCVPSDQLAPTDASSDLDAGTFEIRELLLNDAGNVIVDLGSFQQALPVQLIPDLLPYMSGVEYAYSSVIPSDLLGTPVEVKARADGSQTEEIEPFEIVGASPQPLELEAAQAGDDLIVLSWISDPVAATVLRIASVDGLGTEITCLFEGDTAEVKLSALSALGIGDTDELRITASRSSRSTSEGDGDLQPELVVELRESTQV